MDLQMPEMDGLEATRLIRRTGQDMMRPYIVAMTANAMAGDRERCLAAGMNDYVSKPVRVKALVDALTRAAEAAAERRASAGEAPAEVGEPPETAAETGAASPARDDETQTPRAALAADAQALEQAALDNLLEALGGDEAFLAELVETFLEDAPVLLAEMRKAAQSGSAPDLRLHAHSLKSNSAEFGAMALNAICKKLEMMGKEEELAGAMPLVDEADAAYAAVLPALRALAGN